MSGCGSTTVPPGNGSGTCGPATVACGRCGTEAAAGRNHCPACGCFMPSSTVRQVHGAKALASGRGTPVDQARMAAIEQAVTEDLGGADELSEVQRALIADCAFAIVLRDLLSAHLAAVGPLTKAGKRRAALTSWQQASARVEALAGKIGLERRAAPTPSLADYIEQRQREAEQAASATEAAADAGDDGQAEGGSVAGPADRGPDAGKRAPEPPQDARSSKDAGEDTPGSDAASTANLAADEGISRGGEQARA